MGINIGTKIDAYANKYNSNLRSEETKTGYSMNKYDVAQYMLKKGEITQKEFNEWLKTQEGSQNKSESERLHKMPVFQARSAFKANGEGYLESASNFSLNNILGYEVTSPGKIKTKEVKKTNINVNKQLEEQKFKNHVQSLPKVDADPITLTKQIEAEKEAKKIEHMTYGERKNYIMGKLLDAKDKNDKMGMLDALNEFYTYECEFLDKKFGITDSKEFLKDKSGLNRLVDYIDKTLDDGDDGNISAGERAWEIVKGVGDTMDSFIGTQGFTMAVGLGGATKAAQIIPKAGPLVGGAIQAYFGVEGSQLVFEGTKEIIEADTKEEVRQGASQGSMGAIMVTGATKSAKNGFKKDVKVDKNVSETAEYKVEIKDVDSNAASETSKPTAKPNPEVKPKEELNVATKEEPKPATEEVVVVEETPENYFIEETDDVIIVQDYNSEPVAINEAYVKNYIEQTDSLPDYVIVKDLNGNELKYKTNHCMDPNACYNKYQGLEALSDKKTIEEVLNATNITKFEKQEMEEVYNHICKIGLKKEIDTDPEFFVGLVSQRKMSHIADATKLTKNDLEVMLYAREQYKSGKVSAEVQDLVYDRTDYGTPPELFKYIGKDPNEIPETVYCPSTDSSFKREDIIKWNNKDKKLIDFLETQSTPKPIVVERADDNIVLNIIKIGDSDLGTLIKKGNNPEDLVRQINNSPVPIDVKYDNFVGTSIGGNNFDKGKNSGIRWKISVPKGTKGAYLDGLMNPNLACGENELLLQAGTSLRIKNIEYKSGQFHIEATAVQTPKQIEL